MKYDFTGKSIKCDTWKQMLHLAKLAEEQGYESWLTSKDRFNNGEVYFTVDHHQYMCINECFDDIETTYSEFTNPPLPNEVVEVTGCVDCSFHAFRGESERNYCSIESKYETDKPLFTTCPLLTKSITIKLKQNEPTGN